MKTPLPRSIGSVSEAKSFLMNLISNDEIYHPDDNAHDIVWSCPRPPSSKECDILNELMGQVNTISLVYPEFDPCEFVIGYSLIKDSLVRLHRSCSTDQYGQVPKWYFTPYSIFGDEVADAEKFLNDNPGLLSLSTYGGSSGTYKAYTVESASLRMLCHEALRKNPEYLRNINSYHN